MSEPMFEELEAAVDRAGALLLSGAQKIAARNPSWAEFLTLLTEDEQLAFWAFAEWGERRRHLLDSRQQVLDRQCELIEKELA